VLSWDVRGHGQSPGDRGYIERFTDYLDDFKLAHAAAKQLAPGKPSVLLAHSHGSLITLRALVSDHPPDAACAILSSPYLGNKIQIPAIKRGLAKVLTHIVPRYAEANPLTVEQLIAQQKVHAVIGGYGSQLVQAQSVVPERYAVPFISGGAGATSIYGRSKWVFGTLSPVENLATTQMEFLEDLVKGVVDLKDVIFYLSVITFGIFLAHESVESQRWRA
jgi:hypothetical protein